MHCCYKQEPNSIMGGVSGLDVIMKRLPTSLLKRRLPGVLAAMIRAIQVLPTQATRRRRKPWKRCTESSRYTFQRA